MTDLTSKDNKYYSLSQYNSTTSNVLAETNDVLLYPIIENASDYQVAISKARIDLSGIPLTTNNIPLKTYQVGLKNGDDEYTAYVRQLGATDANYLYNISSAGTYSKYQYSASAGTTSMVNIPAAIPISTYFKTIFQFVETDYENIFVVGSAQPNSSTYELLMGFSKEGVVIYETTFASIQAFCIDRQSKMYLGIESETGSEIQVYQLVETTSPIQLNLVQTITLDANGDDLKQIQTLCAEAQLIVGSEANKVSIYDTQSYNAITTYNEAEITQIGNYSAILSGDDRFLLTDLGAIPDFGYGVQVGGTESIKCVDNAQFVSGSWLDTAKMALWAGTNTYGYGIGTDNQTYYFTYNNGTTGVPVALTDTRGMASIYNGYQPNTIYGLAAGTTGALVALNIDQLSSPSNIWSVIDTSFFPINSQSPIAVDTQGSSGKMLAVGTNNELYVTSHMITPKTIFQFGTTPSIQAHLRQHGVGWNQSGINAFSEVVSTRGLAPVTPGEDTIPLAFTKSGDEAWFLYAVVVSGVITSCNIQKYSLPTWSLVGTPVNLNIYTNSGNQNFDMTYINGIVSISCGTDNTAHNRIYNYDSSTFALLSTITLTNLNYELSNPISVLQNGATYVLACASGNNVYFYDISNPVVPVLLNSVVFSTGGYNITTIGGLKWLSATGGNYLVLTSDIDGTLNQNGLFSGLVDGSYAFASIVSVDITTTYFLNDGNTIGINPNINGIELCIPTAETGNSAEFSGTSVFYNSGDGLFWSKVSQYTPNLGTDELLFFYYCPENDNTFNWEPVSQGGTPISVQCVAFSPSNPNLVYATDTAGVVYTGTLLIPGPTLGTITFTPYAQIAGTFASLNMVATPTGLFNNYIRNYGVSGQTPHGSVHYDSVNILGMARNAITGEFLVSDSSGALKSYNPIALSLNWTNTSVSGLNLIYAKNGEDIDAGAFDIYDFQTLIDAINAAFEEAYLKVPTGVFSSAPSVSLNFTTGLATLNYSSDYSQSLTKGILMNKNLHQLLYYYSVVDSFNANYYEVVLPIGSTSLLQTSKSLYLFNQLDKILFISNTIFVFGSFFGTNNTNNIITDIDVPTNSDGYMNNLGQVVYYQPTFLRPYILNSNIPLSRVQMQVWYSTLDGKQYQLELVPDGNWNAKLIFCRRY